MAKRLAYLDGLRAVAVLSVIVFHLRVHAPGVALEPWAKECSHGVDLFFVLSGFCLAFPTFDALRATGQARFDTVSFALKRLLRIFPPYAAAVVLISAIGAIALARGIPLPQGMHPYNAADVVDELLFVDGNREHINASFWSLAVEFRWYFLFPLALLLAARNLRAFVTALLLVAAAGELTRASSTDLGVLPAFMLGIVAAALRTSGHRIIRFAPILMLVSVGVALLNETRPHFPIQTNVGWHAAAFFFVIFAGEQQILTRILSFPLLTRIGVASYSIYLVHEPIVSATVAALRPRYGDVWSSLAAASLGLLAGFALWIVLERPLTRPDLVRNFVRRNEAGVAKLFAAAGIPRSFTIGAPSAKLVAFPRPVAEQPPLERTAV
jgi:peptidoglycan/LPS O-acetylase OafA/YrhL